MKKENKTIARFLGERIFWPRRYDKDWNALIRAVEKIEEDKKFTVQIESGLCFIYKIPNYDLNDTYISFWGETKQESVFRCVLAFINHAKS